MLYLLVFFSSLIITIFSTPILINFLTRLNIVDVPGGRHINTSAIPRMGGILIYLIIILALVGYSENFNAFRIILLASGFLALCGILDDMRSLKWHYKYLFHSASAVILLLYFYPNLRQVEFFGTLLPYPIDLIVLFLFITGSINAVNMLDGLDGLVSGYSLLLFMLIFMLAFSIGSSFLMILSAACIGSLVGFLKFNANPARIFLGDTGSLILGFFLVVSALLLTSQINPHSLDLGFPIILMGVPLIDTLRVITVRVWKGSSPFTPDNNHIHHMISGNNIRHKTTVFIIQVFTVFYIVLSIIYLYYDSLIAYILFCLSALVLFNINHLMRMLRTSEMLQRLLAKLFTTHLFTIDLYKKYLLPFSAAAVVGMIFVLFPGDAELPYDVILLMLLICGLLFAASYIHSRKDHNYNDIYVLINLQIFFSLTNLTEPWIKYNTLWDNNILPYLAVISLAGIIVFFLIYRLRGYEDGKTLFSGLDMITIILLIFLLIMNNLLDIKGLNFIGGNIILGFTIYIWYKIAKFVVPELTKPAFYLSFALPLITLIIISF